MTNLLALILSDFKHFIGTLILMAWTGAVVAFAITVITNAIAIKDEKKTQHDDRSEEEKYYPKPKT